MVVGVIAGLRDITDEELRRVFGLIEITWKSHLAAWVPYFLALAVTPLVWAETDHCLQAFENPVKAVGRLCKNGYLRWKAGSDWQVVPEVGAELASGVL